MESMKRKVSLSCPNNDARMLYDFVERGLWSFSRVPPTTPNTADSLPSDLLLCRGPAAYEPVESAFHSTDKHDVQDLATAR